MKIEDLRDLYEKDIVFLTQHVIERCKQRNIRPKHIKAAVMTGEIIEDYPDDFPTPSCLILGFPSIGVPLHVVVARKETVPDTHVLMYKLVCILPLTTC